MDIRNLLLAMTLLMLSNTASAVILWDQQPDANLSAIVDQDFPDLSDHSTYMVNDVVFAEDVVINSVTTYFSNTINSGWPQTGSSSATLNIFDGDALTASDDPSTGGDFGLASVVVDYIAGSSGLEVTASSLGISLGAGTYFFGLTPILDLSSFGQEFHQDTSVQLGQLSPLRNPGGGFAFSTGTDWTNSSELLPSYNDMAITISGDVVSVPEPAMIALMVLGLAGIGFSRKRKA